MRRVFVDTAPLIYLVEADEREYVVAQLQRWIEAGDALVSSVITLTELLVHPRRREDERMARKYRVLLDSLLAEPLISIDENVADLAAALRAAHGLRTPDALQLAAALTHGCDIFCTNDRAFVKVDDIEVVLLSNR